MDTDSSRSFDDQGHIRFLDERVSRRQMLVASGFLSGAALLAACGGTANVGSSVATSAGPARTLRLGHVNATTSHIHLAALKLAEVAKAKSNGSLDIQVFPNSQLGSNVQQIEACRTGTQDMSFPSAAETANTAKEWGIFDLPYLFKNVDDANAVFQGPVGKHFIDQLTQYNLYGLGWVSAVDRDLMSRSKPIRSVADVKGLKVRVIQAPGYVESFKALGAIPVPLAYAQLYLALQQGTVDLADTSPDQASQDKFVEVVKYFTLNAMNFIPVEMIISKQVMDGLTKEQQSAIRAAAAEAAKLSISKYKGFVQDAFADMKTRGIEVIQVDTKPWIDATKEVRDRLAAGLPNGQQNLQMILEAAKKAA